MTVQYIYVDEDDATETVEIARTNFEWPDDLFYPFLIKGNAIIGTVSMLIVACMMIGVSAL